MKRILLVIITLTLQLTICSNLATAQNSTTEKPALQGIYIGASLLGASWTLNESDAEAGAGLGLKLGYNFNKNFALFASLDGSSINPNQGENYGLGHFDLGAEARFGDEFKPFARVSYLGMAVVQNNNSGDVEILGNGLGLGAGIYYFPTNQISLEVGYSHSWINVYEISVGSTTSSVDEEAQTGRFSLGMAYHF